MHIAIGNENKEVSEQYELLRGDALSFSVSVRFAISGNLRHLSHAEMLKVFQRACTRAGIPMVYSRGFNPHPRISLPLPRSVGVESDDELLYLRVQYTTPSDDLWLHSSMLVDTQRFRDGLANQLPDGCRLLSVATAQTTTPPQPCSATYVLALRPGFSDDDLKARIRFILDSESLHIERSKGPKGRCTKSVDVRRFIKSIEFRNTQVIVECSVGPAGSIRVEEILSLLNVNQATQAVPVRRTNVQWINN